MMRAFRYGEYEESLGGVPRSGGAPTLVQIAVLHPLG
jgi:hypothetical protein